MMRCTNLGPVQGPAGGPMPNPKFVEFSQKFLFFKIY